MILEYPYNNHQRKIKKKHFKHLIKKIILLLTRSEKMEARTIFSPFQNIKRCTNCDFAMYSKCISDNILLLYYKDIYRKKTKTNEEYKAPDYKTNLRANAQLNFVNDYLKKLSGLRMLEIGAGDATMSRLAKERYSHGNFDVIEPDPRYLEYYTNSGLHLISNFFPGDLKSRTYDYIHTSHWLEHVSNLDETMKELRSLVKKDGLLFVEVPNCNDRYFELDIEDTPHLQFFTEKALKILSIRYDFECIKSGEYGMTWDEDRELRKTRNQNIIDINQNSISKNIHRKGGSTLRMLFKKLV